MLSLVVLFTVFLGLVGALVFLNHLQNKWSEGRASAPKHLRTRVDSWLVSRELHAPTSTEFISVLNKQLISLLQTREEKEHRELTIVELLPDTELPEVKITRILSESDSSLVLECDLEWPMCVPGVAVKVVGSDSRVPIICHLQVEWLYAYAKVILEKGEEGLLLSYANTRPPMMGVSCGVENQSLDDQESAKLASSVADTLQAMFNGLCLERVLMTSQAVAMKSLAVGVVNIPVVLVSAPKDASTGEGCEAGGACEGRGACETREGCASVDNHLTARDSKGQEVIVRSVSSEAEKAGEACEGSVLSGAGEGSACSVISGRSDGGVAGGAGDTSRVNKSSDASGGGDSHEGVTRVSSGDSNQTSSVFSYPPHILNGRSSKGVPAHTESPAESPTSLHWRRSSSYEQLTDSLVDTPALATPPGGVLSTPERKALTMSMAGSEAESLYGADDRIPSTLVFEIKDSTRVRNIVALSSTHANKLRRSFSHAQKLHIYNDHTFLAVHVKDKMLCPVCKHKISGIFGKQGYQCRDCGLTVHKQCHFKTDTLCPSSKVRTMNLIYPTNFSTLNS